VRAIGRRLVVALALVALNWLIVLAEHGGYRDSYDGDVSTVDALYCTTVTLTTTGYGDITPVTTSARLVNAIVVTPMRLLFVVLLVGTTLSALTQRSREEFRLARLLLGGAGQEHAITAAWPGATTHTLDPADARPLPDTPDAAVAVAGGVITLARPEWFPIQLRHDTDPLRPLLEVGAGLHPGQTICVQILTRPAAARPAAAHRATRLRRAAWTLRNHTTHQDPLTTGLSGVLATTTR
jgi:hypothetical protein